jgi:hypothetical protein
MRATTQLHYAIINLLAIPATILFLILTPIALAAPKFRVLHNFGAGNDGAGVWSTLIFDKKGNLYGATGDGGIYGDGAVFELAPTFGGDAQCSCGVVYKLTSGSNGRWKYTRLHVFEGPDGCDPAGGLTIDSKGNLYSAALGGKYGLGVVFEITP